MHGSVAQDGSCHGGAMNGSFRNHARGCNPQPVPGNPGNKSVGCAHGRRYYRHGLGSPNSEDLQHDEPEFRSVAAAESVGQAGPAEDRPADRPAAGLAGPTGQKQPKPERPGSPEQGRFESESLSALYASRKEPGMAGLFLFRAAGRQRHVKRGRTFKITEHCQR